MESIAKIQRLSRFMKYVFIALLALIPLLHFGAWLSINHLPLAMQQSFASNLPVRPELPLAVNTLLLGCAAGIIPVALGLAVMALFVRLFGLYQRGIVFTRENVACYRRLGVLLVISPFADILFNSLMSVVLTLERGPGSRQLTVGLSSANIRDVLIGVMIVLVSWIMNEARAIREEQELTV